jgi:hypothetical protein
MAILGMGWFVHLQEGEDLGFPNTLTQQAPATRNLAQSLCGLIHSLHHTMAGLWSWPVGGPPNP